MSSLVQPERLVVGQRFEVTFELRDVDGNLGDSGTVTFRYASPGGAIATVEPEQVSDGIYRASFLLTAPGTWRYAIDTSNGIDAAFDRAFVVPKRALP